MGESTPSFKIRKKSSLLGCVLELLIATAGGRFPRAWLEPPYASHSGVSRPISRPPESKYIPFAVIERHIFFEYPKFNGGLYILVIWHEYVHCSKYGDMPAESNGP